MTLKMIQAQSFSFRKMAFRSGNYFVCRTKTLFLTIIIIVKLLPMNVSMKFNDDAGNGGRVSML